MTAAGVYRDLTGPPHVVQRRLAELHDSGTLLAMTPPRPCGTGWRVRVWVRTAGPAAAASRPGRMALPARPAAGPAWAPPAWLTRQVAARAAAVAGVGAVVAGLVWVVWQAATGAVAWTTDHTGTVLAALLLAGIGAAAWVSRKLRRASAPACTTTTVHGRRCRGH